MKTSIDSIVSISTPRGLELYARLVLNELPQCEVERTRDTKDEPFEDVVKSAQEAAVLVLVY